VWNIPVACKQAMADLMFGIHNFDSEHYQPDIPVY
jgi:methylglyoxal synthase